MATGIMNGRIKGIRGGKLGCSGARYWRAVSVADAWHMDYYTLWASGQRVRLQLGSGGTHFRRNGFIGNLRDIGTSIRLDDWDGGHGSGGSYMGEWLSMMKSRYADDELRYVGVGTGHSI